MNFTKMDKIQLTQRLLRGDLNTRELRKQIISYNNFLETHYDEKKEKKIKHKFKKIKPRLIYRGGKNKLDELKELEKRGFF